MLARRRTRRNGDLLFNGHGVPVWDDKRALQMHGGEGCTTLQGHLMLLVFAVENG